MGYDAFVKLPTWHQWEELPKYANFIVVSRPDVEISMTAEIKQFLKQAKTFRIDDLSRNLNGKVYFLRMHPIPISATKVREKLKQFLKPKFDLPENVLRYIQIHRLYLE